MWLGMRPVSLSWPKTGIPGRFHGAVQFFGVGAMVHHGGGNGLSDSN